MLVILDLDMTLIDTGALQAYRDARRWREIKNHLRETCLYPGVKEMVNAFHENNIRMAVVTNSPGMYAKDLLDYYSLPVDKIIGYHDTRCHKPNPEPFLLAISLLHSDKEHTVAIGDSVNDILAAKNAGVVSCAALWGCSDAGALRNAGSEHDFSNPGQFKDFVLNSYTDTKTV